MNPYSVPRGVSRPSASFAVAGAVDAGVGAGGTGGACAAPLTAEETISSAATSARDKGRREEAMARPEPMPCLLPGGSRQRVAVEGVRDVGDRLLCAHAVSGVVERR